MDYSTNYEYAHETTRKTTEKRHNCVSIHRQSHILASHFLSSWNEMETHGY